MAGETASASSVETRPASMNETNFPSLGRQIRGDIDAWDRIWHLREANGRHRSTLQMGLHLAYSYCGFRATLLYRLSHSLHRSRVRLLPSMLCRLNLMLHGFDVPPSVAIGAGLYVPHPVGTVVMAHQIGRNCTLVSGVTIGMRNEPRFPRIGDEVFVGAGARVLGDITVGDGVRIGANAVVLTDVPAHCVAVGVPATIRALRDATAEGAEAGLNPSSQKRPDLRVV